MRAFVRAALLGAALWLPACGLVPTGSPRIGVEAETMPWANMSTYRTYRWATQTDVDRHRYPDRDEREEKIDWRIRNAIDAGLAAHGYVPDATGKPDFIVSYRIAIAEDHTSSFQDYAAYRAEGGTKGMGEAFMGYQRGVIRVEIRDAKTGKVAWRGTATAIADGSGRRIEPAVQQIMDRLPPAG